MATKVATTTTKTATKTAAPVSKVAAPTTSIKTAAPAVNKVALAAAAATAKYSPAYKQEAARNDGVVALVSRAYQQALGRSPDSGGLATYTNAIRSGSVKDFNHLITILYSSEEYQGLGPYGVFERQWAQKETEARAAAQAEFGPYYEEQKTGKEEEQLYENQLGRQQYRSQAEQMMGLMGQSGMGTSPYGYQGIYNLAQGRQTDLERATNLYNQAMKELTREEEYNIEANVLKRKGEAFTGRYLGDLRERERQTRQDVLTPYLSQMGGYGYGY